MSSPATENSATQRTPLIANKDDHQQTLASRSLSTMTPVFGTRGTNLISPRTHHLRCDCRPSCCRSPCQFARIQSERKQTSALMTCRGFRISAKCDPGFSVLLMQGPGNKLPAAPALNRENPAIWTTLQVQQQLHGVLQNLSLLLNLLSGDPEYACWRLKTRRSIAKPAHRLPKPALYQLFANNAELRAILPKLGWWRLRRVPPFPLIPHKTARTA